MQTDAGRTKVLIVDDEPAVADTLALVFRTSGYDVKVAYSAEQAIETIAVWAPGLALVDVMLPGMNGIDLAVVLKDNYPGCRSLLFSGCQQAGELLEEAARKGHQFDIMAKPTHPAELLERVKNLLTAGYERPKLIS